MTGLVVFACLAAAALLLLPGGRQAVPRESTSTSAHPQHGWISDPALMLDLIAAMLEAGQPLTSALAILADGVDPATRRDLIRLLGALELGVPWETAWQLSAGGGASGQHPARVRQRGTRHPPGQTQSPARMAAPGQTGPSGPTGASAQPPSAQPPSALAALGPALRFTATTGAPSAAVLYSQADSLRRRRQAESRRRAAALGVRLVVPLGLCSLPAFVALTVVPLLLSLLPGGF